MGNQNSGYSATSTNNINQGNYVSSMSNDTVLMASEVINKPITRKVNKYTPDIWIADTGASCHITNNDTGMFDVQILKDDCITVADDHDIRAVKIGKLQVMAMQEDGIKRNIYFGKSEVCSRISCETIQFNIHN